MSDKLFRDIADFLNRSAYLSDLKKQTLSMGTRSKAIFSGFFVSFHFVIDLFGLYDFTRLKRKNLILFFSHSVTRYKSDDGEVNRFVLPFVEELDDYSILNLEDGAIGKGVEGNSGFQEYSLVAVLGLIRSWLFLSKLFFFVFNYTKPKQTGSAMFQVYTVRLYAKLFELIIRLVKPKVVFTINWYSAKGLSLMMAAHSCNVRVVDIQHGLAAEAGHRCYKNLKHLDKRLLPDYFLSWSPNDAELLNREFGRKVAYPVGSLSLSSVSPSQSNKVQSDSKTLLIILGIGCPSWLESLIDQANLLRIKCIIRAHPSFPIDTDLMTVKGDVAFSKNEPFSKCFDQPLIAVVGEWSAGLIEASHLGIPAVSIGDKGRAYYEGLENIVCCSNIDECMNFLNDINTNNHVHAFEMLDLMSLREVINEIA